MWLTKILSGKIGNSKLLVRCNLSYLSLKSYKDSNRVTLGLILKMRINNSKIMMIYQFEKEQIIARVK